MKELIDAPEDILSTLRANSEITEARYTFSGSIATNFYHADVIREKLPRHIGDLMPHIVDEICAALEDKMPFVYDGFFPRIPHQH
jgi:hypothetical protein